LSTKSAESSMKLLKQKRHSSSVDNLLKGHPPCNNHLLNFKSHLVRVNTDASQVNEYPRFQNLPMLKIIEEELRGELEIWDDVEVDDFNLKQSYSPNK